MEMKLGSKIALATVVLALAGLPAFSAEEATLRNGFAIRHERHEARGDLTRLFLSDSSDNFIDIPTAEILGFEEIVRPPAPAPQADLSAAPAATLDAVVSAASSHTNIDPDLILSVIRAESGFNPNAVSRKGAQGLMQLMPQTAARLGVQDAFDPSNNVEGGTRYLGQLLARYHNDLPMALAAYNAGPERVEQYRGVPPYRETRLYINRIIRDFNRKKLAQRGPQGDSVHDNRAEQNSKQARPNETSDPGSSEPGNHTSTATTGF